MTQAHDTLTNIALAFAGELAAREERLAEAQRAEQRASLKIIEQGFSKMSEQLIAVRADIAELKASDRELLSGLQNLQGQVAAMQRTPKA